MSRIHLDVAYEIKSKDVYILTTDNQHFDIQGIVKLEIWDQLMIWTIKTMSSLEECKLWCDIGGYNLMSHNDFMLTHKEFYDIQTFNNSSSLPHPPIICDTDFARLYPNKIELLKPNQISEHSHGNKV